MPPEPGPDLSGKDLVDLDLSGTRLRDVNLAGANLSGAWLYNARITGEFLGLTMNGVEVAPLIAAELKRIIRCSPRSRRLTRAG
ncbi:MAG: pentapeptide repeat-containing protein [Actinobacteria bacterium]|nr:pentapeptide repeat-containing protein [Actinomycetota bacterium]